MYKRQIRDGKTPNLDRPLHDGTEINLRVPALIPDNYLPDVNARLVLYKRIANAETKDQLRELQVEMIDRFGLLPDTTRNLFRVTEIKLQADRLGIKKIDSGVENGRVEFQQDTLIDPGAIIDLVQSEPHRYKLTTANQLSFHEEMAEPETRFTKVARVLDSLEKKRIAIAS